MAERESVARPTGQPAVDPAPGVPYDPADVVEREVRVEPVAERRGPFRRDLFRWGPIVAGVFVTLTTLTVLGALGLAIGVSVYEPNAQGLAAADAATTGWAIGTAVIAFLLGGYAAGASLAIGGVGPGTANGVMVAVSAITATVVLVGVGVGNVLGSAAANLQDITELATTFEVQSGQSSASATAAFDEAADAAWTTFTTLVLALILAAVGGALGGGARLAAAGRSDRTSSPV